MYKRKGCKFTRMSSEEKLQCIKRYQNNEPWTILIKDIGQGILNKILKEANIPKRKPLKRGPKEGSVHKYTKDYTELLNDVKNRFTYKQLRMKYKISRQRIYQICKKNGVKKVKEKLGRPSKKEAQRTVLLPKQTIQKR